LWIWEAVYLISSSCTLSFWSPGSWQGPLQQQVIIRGPTAPTNHGFRLHFWLMFFWKDTILTRLNMNYIPTPYLGRVYAIRLNAFFIFSSLEAYKNKNPQANWIINREYMGSLCIKLRVCLVIKFFFYFLFFFQLK